MDTETYWNYFNNDQKHFTDFLQEQEKKPSEVIDTTFDQGLNALHKACVVGFDDMVLLLLELNANTEVEARDSYKPIHHCCSAGFEEILQILLEHNANIESITEDRDYYVSGTPLYVSGGQTALHVAANNGNEECVTLLLQFIRKKFNDEFIDKYLQIQDNDGNTAFKIAVLSKSFTVAEVLIPNEKDRLQILGVDSWPPSSSWISEYRAENQKIQSLRFVTRKKELKEKQRKQIREQYEPVCDLLIDDNITEESFMNLLLSENVKKLLKSNDENLNFEEFGIEEAIPGLFLIPDFFSKEGITLLRCEQANFLNSGLPIERPNISIPYGFKLDPTGLFDGWLNHLKELVVKKIGKILFPSMSILKSSQTFLKHYIAGKDTKPSTHYDPSELTFSICLGDEFEGSEVYFHEVAVEDGCSCTERKPHPEPCSDCQLILPHTVGQAVFHVGKHIHGVFPLESGERWQMIMWLYSY